MDNMKNIEKTEKYAESIKELFKEMVSDEFYDKWADTFEIECSAGKKIVITYNGTENIKKFKNNNALNGIIEVKGFQVRVVFARLNKNTYALISAFIKKCDNDNGYVSVLKQKVADYRSISETLKKNLSNPEFMDQQREYTEGLDRSSV